MKEKIILKPTDYVAYEDGTMSYSYPMSDQYNDGESLNKLSEKDLKKECQNRWSNFKNHPTPANYSKLSIAQDLAYAKGFKVTFNKENSIDKIHDFEQREF